MFMGIYYQFVKSVTTCRLSPDLRTGRLRSTDVISLVTDRPLYAVVSVNSISTTSHARVDVRV